MHQHVQSLTDSVNVWELHEPGERYRVDSVETLRRYALAPETECVRISSKMDGSEVEFRLDGPEGRLLWHELKVNLTPREIVSLNEICQETFKQGKLEVVQERG